MKVKDKGIVTNIGLYDGLAKDDILIITKIKKDSSGVTKNKIILRIKKVDTLLAYAEPENKKDIDVIDSNDIVIPYKRRRAARIE